MTIYKNYNTFPIELHIRRPGIEYDRPIENNTQTETATYSTLPFEGVLLRPGQEVDINGAEVVSAINLLKNPAISPFSSGTSYTNTTGDIREVLFRINGKSYAQTSSPNSAYNSPTASSDDFDMIRVNPGQTVTLGDSVITYTGPLRYAA